MIPFSLERPEFLWLLLLGLPFVGLALWTRRSMVGRFRRLLSLGFRLLLLLVVVTALSGLTYLQSVDALGVVFVVDRSASVSGSAQARAQDFIREALTHQQGDDRVGIVVFGDQAMVEAEPQEELSLGTLEATPSPHQSDLAAGLRLGTALLPADRSRRLILLTDGEQTRGDAAGQALLTATGDLSLSVVELTTEDGPDVLLESLLAPSRVAEGAAFEVRVVLRAEEAVRGKLRLYRNADYLGEMPVDLPAGRAQVLPFRQEAQDVGLYRYRASFEADDPALDSRGQNNQVMSTVQVLGRPRVLIVDVAPLSVQPLVEVLTLEGLDVDVRTPADLPSSLGDFRPYAAVFLTEAPAFSMSVRQQVALQSYVRDLGRGLAMLGSDQSFGLGGFYRTPLEEALPVGVDLEDKTRFPKLGMIHAIDKSCSMGGGAGSKLMLAKEAALQTVDLLSAQDMLGVIGFDGAASFIVPLQELHDKQRVIDDISSIRSGGGTDIYPALERSIDALQNSDAALKHIVLISDGMTSSGSFQTLIQRGFAEKITLTTIGVGSDTDRKTMEDFAKWGGGNFYLVTDTSAIPAIFTRETLLATRQFLIEEPVHAEKAANSELVAGIDTGALPTLQGYVVTSPKSRATVPWVITRKGRSDPLLAHWRYGLGRSVAFTSDAKARWANDWLRTPAYAALWGQVARYLVAKGGEENLQLDTSIREGRLHVTVDAFDADGQFRNFLTGETRIVAPDLTVRTLQLEQVAPGRYAASIPVDQDGSWLAGVSLSDQGTVIGQAVEEAVQPYSPEYRSKGAGNALIRELARVGGGSVLTDPAEVFRRPEVARRVPYALWPWLMGLAAVLLLLDVALRRLAVGGSGPRELLQPAPAAPRYRFSPTAPRPTVPKPAAEPESTDELPPPPPAEVVDPTSYAGRLLAARKKARSKLGDEP